MTAIGRLGVALLGMILGAGAGAGVGLAGGLIYTEVAQTSGFEGYSGYVVVFWMACGLLIGLFAGPFFALKWARR
ncbi:MAG: hypothetical protein M9944_11735 [Rhizobiaceae bacterium]|nr:hypothetical protein [Rhizobiaceae bacterium]